MAPEILSHQRYDEKADLWSVGTVLFEMIAGKPPFNGDNHIHLLSNIQKNAVRLPPGVRVSKECVHLLRILLNRNPMQRATIPEFVTACKKFVALGIHGPTPIFQDPRDVPPHLTSEPITESLMTVEETMLSALSFPYSNQQQEQQQHAIVTPSLSPAPLPPSTPPMTISSSLAPLPVATTSRPRVLPSPARISPLNAAATNPLNVAPRIQSIAGGQAYPVSENMAPISHRIGGGVTKVLSPQQSQGSLQNSTDDFVMVEHVNRTSDSMGNDEREFVSTLTSDQMRNNRFRLQQSPPSTGIFRKGGNIVRGNQPRDYVIPKPSHHYKGMLSTSPGTGGALMGMFMGRGLLAGNNNNHPLPDRNQPTSQEIEQQITAATKMLAASEDVGRRAVSVAHLGDSRAVRGIKLYMIMMEASSTSSVFMTTMDGIEEERDGGVEENNNTIPRNSNSRNVINDSGCTEPMVTSHRYRRQRSSMSTMEDIIVSNKSMNNTSDSDVVDEMPFALQSESPPAIISAGIPSRPVGQSMTAGYHQYMTSSRNVIVKPTPGMIRSHFSEALLCYVKALNMLKGAFAAVEGVLQETDRILLFKTRTSSTASHQLPSLLSSEQIEYLQQMKNSCEITKTWLGQQFNGVLERGDAANTEIRKIPLPSEGNNNHTEGADDDDNTVSIDKKQYQQQQQQQQEQSSVVANATVAAAVSVPVVLSVEELIYTQALTLGREGAVKQLLGQNELARTCYRSAGLLAETLLMDSKNIVGDDRKTLEYYVDAFATQISELDTILRQQQQQQQQQQLQQQHSGGSSQRSLIAVGSHHNNLGPLTELPNATGNYSTVNRSNPTLQLYATPPTPQRRISSGGGIIMDMPLLPLAVDPPPPPLL
jgi:Protein kinase domain/Domain of unknown function (DUF3543)